ncbi:DUF1828 domain-containing protein [Pectobacterium carotovorum]|uniref:DUF1828 domain-containing protein n=1 Tax=Pectobacterium carotovorum TaxID=554 RepID=UPI0013740162|nr:DUF1828 domain-containing protein [Pectobacterium carotovorum subsp. carotovorum]
MMCSTVISRLGFECHPIGREILRIISPFTYCDDGEHVGAFVQEINGRYKVSDRSDALMNMESRGITITKKRLEALKAMLAHEGSELNERGEIIKWATEEDIGTATSSVIRAGILASMLSIDWYQPINSSKFESEVIDFLYKSQLNVKLALREEIVGMSGHKIMVPITVKSPTPKYVFTSSVKEGGNWNGAYSLLGKLIDLRQANTAVNNRYVVVDSEAIGSQLQQLSLLFNETSHVLPFSARHKWLERLAA